MILRNDSTTQKLVLIGLLSALGAVLMAFIQLPYPPVPFLRIEFSDVAVLIAFLLFGFKEALFVGLLKALINALVMGLVGPYGIGQISAFIASMTYVLGLALMIHAMSNRSKPLKILIVIVLVTGVMTFVNYMFVTPIYFGSWTFLGVREWLNLSSFGLSGTGTYLTTILIVYVPFNLIKGVFVMSVYYVIETATKNYIRTEKALTKL